MSSLKLMSIVLLAISATPTIADSPRQIREGGNSYGKTILSVDGDRVRQGNSSYGNVLYTIDGSQIREGNSTYGKVLATVQSDGRITEGSGSIANVKEGAVREGSSSFGQVIANTNGGRMSGAAAATHLLLR